MRSTLLQPSLNPLPRPKVVALALLFLLAWGLRLHTQHPVFHPDDSPETTLAGALAGIQHPPGYPVYSLLTRLAHETLPGQAAWQAGQLAGLLSSLSVLLVLWLTLVLASGLTLQAPGNSWSHRLWILTLALASLTLPQVWFQGLSGKGGIYGLNLVLSLASLGLFWSGRDGQSWRKLRLGALLVGLGLANHYMSFVLFVPAMLWWSWQAKPSYKAQARLALWILPGLSLYLYLPLRAMHQPFLNWGDPSTWARFWQCILRSQYAAGEVARHFSKTIELTNYLFSMIPYEVTWVAVALAIVGIVASWNCRAAQLRPLLLCFALHLFLVLNYNNPPLPWVINAFFVPDFVLILLFAFIGAETLYPRFQTWHPKAAFGLALSACIAVLLAFPNRYRHLDYSHDFLLYDYSRDIQQGLGRDSALLASGGNDAFGLWYLQGIEKRRLDLKLVDVPLIGDWYLEQLRQQLPELDPAWTTRDQVVQGLLANAKRPRYYTSHNPGDRGIPLGLVTLVPTLGSSLPLSVGGLVARLQIMRLRWAADTVTPWDGNRDELTEYYALAAASMRNFGQRQGIAPLVQTAAGWEQALKAAREGQRR